MQEGLLANDKAVMTARGLINLTNVAWFADDDHHLQSGWRVTPWMEGGIIVVHGLQIEGVYMMMRHRSVSSTEDTWVCVAGISPEIRHIIGRFRKLEDQCRAVATRFASVSI